MIDDLFERGGAGVERLEMPAGTVLVRAGEQPAGIHRLVVGSAAVTVPQGDRDVQVATLGAGAVVGEISLLSGSLPTATVTMTSTGTVERLAADAARAVLDGDPALRAALTRKAEARVDRGAVAQLLTELLELGDDEVASRLAAALPVHRLESDEVLPVPGAAGDTLFAVVTGRLAVREAGAAGSDELARLGRGQVVGRTTLRGAGEPEVVAVRASVVVELPDDVVVDVLGSSPSVLLHVVRRLAELGATATASRRGVAATLAIVTTATSLNPRILSTWVEGALAPFGSVAVVTPARVDADLQRPGIADVTPGDDAAPRLRAYLHERELDVERLLLEVGRDRPAWAQTVSSIADRVVVVASADPDDEEDQALRGLLASVPDRTTTILVLLHPQGTERPVGSAAIRDRYGVDTVLHTLVGDRAGIERAARIAGGCAVGLVLGGGGARGFAHLGVKTALTEHGVPVDVVVGASMGAPLAGGIACGIDDDGMRPLCRRLFKDLLDYTVPVVSLIKGERITAAIEAQFEGWDFEDTWIPFRCVSTNLTTSETVVHRSGPISPAVRASVAIPGVMPPVPSGDDLLVDGGVLNNLPVDIVRDEGVGTIIAVDVAPRQGPRARGDYGLSVSGWTALRRTLGRGRSSYPGIAAVLLRSMLVGSVSHLPAALEAADVDLLIEIPVPGVSLLAFEAVDEVADVGYATGEPIIRAWLEERGGWAG